MKNSTIDIINDFYDRYPKLQYLHNELIEVVEDIVKLAENGHKLLMCGNGGSCAECEHMAGELNKGFKLKRPIPESLSNTLKELYPEDHEKFARNLQQPITAIPLSTFVASYTAFLNDCDPDIVYAQMLYAMAQPGDILLCLSTSGNSKNIIYPAKLAKALGIKVVSFTGEKGGALREYSDLLFAVPGTKSYIVQENHLPLHHAICLAVENELFGEKDN